MNINSTVGPEEFWERFAGADLVLWTYKDKDSVKIELEDLYQRFKERMMRELAVMAPDLRTHGVLVERPSLGLNVDSALYAL